jgi:hypothetical protein
MRLGLTAIAPPSELLGCLLRLLMGTPLYTQAQDEDDPGTGPREMAPSDEGPSLTGVSSTKTIDNERGTGRGVTWNCAVDDEISDDLKDCLVEWTTPVDQWFRGPGVLLPRPDDRLTGTVRFDVTAQLEKGIRAWAIRIGSLRRRDRLISMVIGLPVLTGGWAPYILPARCETALGGDPSWLPGGIPRLRSGDDPARHFRAQDGPD